MKTRLTCTAGFALGLLALTGTAEAKGCLKGAAVGCAVGHSKANKKDQQPGGGQQAPQQN